MTKELKRFEKWMMAQDIKRNKMTDEQEYERDLARAEDRMHIDSPLDVQRCIHIELVKIRWLLKELLEAIDGPL